MAYGDPPGIFTALGVIAFIVTAAVGVSGLTEGSVLFLIVMWGALLWAVKRWSDKHEEP